MAVVEVLCIYCNSKNVVKNGKSTVGEQRYKCRTEDCGKTFQLIHRYNACEQGIKERIVDMAMNGFWRKRYRSCSVYWSVYCH